MSVPLLVLILAIFAILMVLRLPIGLSLLFAGCVGYIIIRGPIPALSAVAGRIWDIGATYELSAVPQFLLMGYLAHVAGVTTDLYMAARAWMGHLKGSLVIATTYAAAAFGAACGSITSSTAVFAKVAIPEMLKLGINRRLAAGCVATVGTLAGMIPPSVNLIVYGILARQSVPQLFMAGYIPGAMTAIAYSAMVYTRVKRNPALAPVLPKASWAVRRASVGKIWGLVVLAVLVMGGLFSGLFTPTEAGAVGAGGAFVMAAARGRLNGQSLREAFGSTARTTSVIFITLVGALILSSYLAVSGVSTSISNWLVGLGWSPLALVGMYMAILLALGCIVDPISMMFLTVPLMAPPLFHLGVNPIWLGILVEKTLEIGALTPPMAINAFMLKTVVPEFSLQEIFGGIWYFLQVELVTLALLIIFPVLSTVLPEAVFGPATVS